MDFATRLALEELHRVQTTPISRSTQTPIVMYQGQDFGHDDPSLPPGTPPFARLGSPHVTANTLRLAQLFNNSTDEQLGNEEAIPAIRRRYSWLASVMGGSFRGTTASGTEVHYTGSDQMGMD